MFEVIVIGGGVSGICAALQAARTGRKTCLIEKNGVCGGTLTAGGISRPGLFNAWGRQIIAGIGWELVVKTLRETGQEIPSFEKEDMSDYPEQQVGVNPLIFAAVTDAELRKAGVDLRLHTMPGSLARKGESWEVVLCGKDGLYREEARFLIDCTGDANAVKLAGFPCRESAECQPGTWSVMVCNYDFDALDWPRIEENYRRACKNGEVFPEDFGWSDGVRMFLRRHGGNSNHITGIRAADSAGKTRMELAGRESAWRAYRFLRKQPGLEKMELVPVSWECGVRETRTIVGETTVSVEDYLSGRRFEDALCWSFYPVDLHDSSRKLDMRPLEKGVVPTVPRGALIPKNSKGIFAAGRIISSDRLANSALRIQATCMATGQAAGALAALCCRNHCEGMELPLEEIRSLLKEHHAIVPE